MSSAVAEAEKLRAAGDAHKRDLVQAKLVEREAELASMREKLWAANREVSSEIPCTRRETHAQAIPHDWNQHSGAPCIEGWGHKEDFVLWPLSVG